jgi:hypothetical protein
MDRYIRVRAPHAQAHRPQLWLGVNNRGPMTANGTGEARKGDLMEPNCWSSPQMLRRYGASARSARARRIYGRIMASSP